MAKIKPGIFFPALYFNLFVIYLVGISASNCFMRFQNGATQLIWQRSNWV